MTPGDHDPASPSDPREDSVTAGWPDWIKGRPEPGPERKPSPSPEPPKDEPPYEFEKDPSEEKEWHGRDVYSKSPMTLDELLRAKMAPTLAAWTFPNVHDADRAITRLKSLQVRRRITVPGAVTLTWPRGREKPRTRQLHSLTGFDQRTGAFWALLFGLVLNMPSDYASRYGTGAFAGALKDVGIDDRFISRVKKSVTPGTSALFLLASDSVVEQVSGALEGMNGKPVASKLPPEVLGQGLAMKSRADRESD